MKKTRVLLLVICIMLYLFFPTRSFEKMAIAATSTNTISLNVDDIKKRAKDHYIDVKLAKLNRMTTSSQLNYTGAQLEQVELNSKHLSQVILPTTLEELRKSIDGYDDLPEEQQIELDYMLSIQILINQSLNPIFRSSYVSQSFQNDSSIQSLKENVHSLEGQIKIHEYEIYRAEALVQYQAAYMYYELIKLSNEIKIQEIINEQASQRTHDMNKLLENGYAFLSEQEQVERNKQQQQMVLTSLKQQHAQQLSIFAGELGYTDKYKIELLNPAIPLKATLFTYDDKKILEQNIDYKIEQQKLVTEQNKYEDAVWYDHDLSQLQKQFIAVQQMRADLAEEQIKRTINNLKVEGSSQYDQLQQQEMKIKDQEQRKLEYELKYKSGLVSISELEEVQIQYQIDQLQLLNMKLTYEQFHEKWKLAIIGVLI